MLPQIVQDIVGESHDALMQGRTPEGVLPYLIEQRGVNEQSLKLFEIGFCDASFERKINRAFYDLESQKMAFPYGRHIRDRVIVPIKNDCGKLVSFATRPASASHDWWNFPFTKGSFLFGLNKSRSACFHKNKLYLVEGYFDVIVLFQKGLQNIACPMGTRFSLVQAGLVLRYCNEVCLCFDTDPLTERGGPGAGQRAMLRILSDDAVKPLLKITTIKLPMGIDPDEFVLSKRRGITDLLALEGKPRDIEGLIHGETR